MKFYVPIVGGVSLISKSVEYGKLLDTIVKFSNKKPGVKDALHAR